MVYHVIIVVYIFEGWDKLDRVITSIARMVQSRPCVRSFCSACRRRKIKERGRWIVLPLILVSLVLSLAPLKTDTWADGPFDALTPNEYTFIGRRGATYTATWDFDTYEITIATSDGTFPWDWTAFVNSNGAIALAGHSDVADTFEFSDPTA